MSTPDSDSDGDNVTASGDSDADSDIDGGYEAKNGQIWNTLALLVTRGNNIVIGKPGLTVYSENISSSAETLKLFISNDILNEVCHHTNAEDSSRIPKLLKDISSELFAFLGLCIVSGILRTRKEPIANLWTTNAAYD